MRYTRLWHFANPSNDGLAEVVFGAVFWEGKFSTKKPNLTEKESFI